MLKLNTILPSFLKQCWVASGVLSNIVGIGLLTGYPYSLLPGLLSPDSDIKTDVTTASWLVSSASIAAGFGYLTSSYLMERLGRKMTHLITIIPMVIGSLLIYFANNVLVILAGRLLNGYSAGCTLILGAVILSEYSSPKNRGLFLNLKCVAQCVGVTALHVIAQYSNWRNIALYCTIPFLFTIANNLSWPESPSWLASKHRFEECEKSFYWLRGMSDASKKELEALKQQQSMIVETNESLQRKVLNILKKFTKRNFLQPLLIITCAFALLESGGRHSFSNYANDIIEGVTNTRDSSNSFYYVIGMDLVILIGNGIACVLVKIMKRRTLLFYTGITCIILLVILTVYLYLGSFGIIADDRPWIPLTLFVLYMLFFSFGCSSIPLALLGEVFPLEHRGVGAGVAGVSTALLLFVTLQTAPMMFIAIGVKGAFVVYCVIMIICLVYLYFGLPETKNKTLLEIEEFFERGKGIDEKKKGCC